MVGVEATFFNNLVVEFTRDVTIMGELKASDLEIVAYHVIGIENEDGSRTLVQELSVNVTWTLPDKIYDMLPSRILYI